MINSKGWLWLRRRGEGVQDQFVKTDLDTLATALYVKTDDWLKGSPQLAPWRPAVGIIPRLSDAELVTLAVMQALLGFTSEARWLRHARAQMRHLFPYLPQQPGYNKRLRAAAPMIRHCIRLLAVDTSVWTDDVWVVDSTPVECGRSRETAKRSDLAGWAEYGYCASHSRYFWGTAAAPGLHAAGPARRLRPGRRQSRRARRADRHAHRRPEPGRSPARPDPHRRTRTTTAPPSRPPSPPPGSGCCGPPAKASPREPARTCSGPCGRSSNRSTTPSKASLTWNSTAATPPPA
jgi:hypothetical protein